MKDFLLICDKNCATYKEVFPLFKKGMASFGSPVKQYDGTDKKFGNHGWITTFQVANKKKLVLTATYDPDKHRRYDNYDAINVDRVKDIPWDYDGVMGVPITILDHNLDNVEIIGDKTINGKDTKIEGKEKYRRVLIKKNFEIEEHTPEQFEILDINPHFFIIVEQGYEKPKQLSLKKYGLKDPYARILIRRKK